MNMLCRKLSTVILLNVYIVIGIIISRVSNARHDFISVTDCSLVSFMNFSAQRNSFERFLQESPTGTIVCPPDFNRAHATSHQTACAFAFRNIHRVNIFIFIYLVYLSI